MFKGFQNKSRQFNGFPNLNFQVNNEAYGYSGCVFWLDAGFGLLTNTNNDNISFWNCRIPTAINFTQTTVSLQPNLILNSPDFNNRSIISFSTSGDQMLSNLPILSSDNFTYVFVFRKISNAGVQNRMIGFGSSGNRYFSPGGTNPVGYYNVSTGILTGTTNDTASHIMVMNKTELFVDGVSENTGTGTYGASSFNYLGGSTATGAAYTGLCDIAEILIYSNNFNSVDCVKISDYLNSKYAIY